MSSSSGSVPSPESSASPLKRDPLELLPLACDRALVFEEFSIVVSRLSTHSVSAPKPRLNVLDPPLDRPKVVLGECASTGV